MASCSRLIPLIFDEIIHIMHIVFSRLKYYLDCSYQFLLFNAHPLFIHICYFISISFLGFMALRHTPLKDPHGRAPPPHDLDLFFTSVSAATVSSMSTIEMEVFSNSQLIVLTALMLIGGEVFTSTAGLHFSTRKLKRRLVARVEHDNPNRQQVELSDLDHHQHQLESGSTMNPGRFSHPASSPTASRYDAAKCLVNVLIGYLLLIHLAGSISILVYVTLISSAREVLRKKDISVSTFSIFATVSSFSSCGFIPTNENMMAFKKNSGLLLLIVPQVLAGNTMFPPLLRFCIWVLKRLTKRSEYEYLLRSSKGGTGYYHLLPHTHSVLLATTAAGLVVIQVVVICSLEWQSQPAVFGGMSSCEKLVSALFLSVNSRHTGESVVDLSSLSQAVLALFVIMIDHDEIGPKG